jgi:hypothetical protein
MEKNKNGTAGIFVILGLAILIAITGCIDKGKLASTNLTNEQNVIATPIHQKISDVGISSSTSGMMERFNLDKLVSLSDSVVIAEVVDILPSRWNTQNGEKPTVNDGISHIIYTDITIKIVEYLKGSLGNTTDNTTIVRTIGGMVGQDKQYVEDQPSYNVNEKVLIFLKNDSDPRTVDIGNKHFVTTGSMQGKITIPANNEVIIGDTKLSLEEAKIAITGRGEKSYGNI